MSNPENFTDGEIPDDLFQWAYDSAAQKRTRIGIEIRLKKKGIQEEVVARHLDKIMAAGKKERTKGKRGHVIIGWGIMLFGVV